MYLIGGIASGYGGYLLNVCYQPGKDINYFFNRLDQVMAAPFANYWNETSLKAIILGIFVYVIGMVMYVTSRKNYMPGQEFGTAVFADPKKVAKQFADKDEHNNLILSQNVRLSMNTRKTRRNLNVLVILVHGETQSPSVKQGFPDHYRSQRGDFKMLRRYAESAWIPDTGAEPGGNGAV